MHTPPMHVHYANQISEDFRPFLECTTSWCPPTPTSGWHIIILNDQPVAQFFFKPGLTALPFFDSFKFGEKIMTSSA